MTKKHRTATDLIRDELRKHARQDLASHAEVSRRLDDVSMRIDGMAQAVINGVIAERRAEIAERGERRKFRRRLALKVGSVVAAVFGAIAAIAGWACS